MPKAKGGTKALTRCFAHFYIEYKQPIAEIKHMQGFWYTECGETWRTYQGYHKVAHNKFSDWCKATEIKMLANVLYHRYMGPRPPPV
jgi:hypothetical protein